MIVFNSYFEWIYCFFVAVGKWVVCYSFVSENPRNLWVREATIMSGNAKDTQEKYAGKRSDRPRNQKMRFWKRTAQFRFGVAVGVFVGLGTSFILLKTTTIPPENTYKNTVFNTDKTETIAPANAKNLQGIVRTDQAFLYDEPNDATKKGAYLAKNQNVEVLETFGKFFKISYKNIDGSRGTAWVLKKDIQKETLLRRKIRFSMQ